MLNNNQILKEILPNVSDNILEEMLKYSKPEAQNIKKFNEAINLSIGHPGCLVAKAIIEFAHNSGEDNLYSCFVKIAKSNGFDIETNYNELRPKGWIVSIKENGHEISSLRLLMVGGKSTRRLTCYPSFVQAQKEIIHQAKYHLDRILDKVNK